MERKRRQDESPTAVSKFSQHEDRVALYGYTLNYDSLLFTEKGREPTEVTHSLTGQKRSNEPPIPEIATSSDVE
jgi:hypothetical protein